MEKQIYFPSNFLLSGMGLVLQGSVLQLKFIMDQKANKWILLKHQQLQYYIQHYSSFQQYNQVIPVLRKDSTATVNRALFRVCSTTDLTCQILCTVSVSKNAYLINHKKKGKQSWVQRTAKPLDKNSEHNHKRGRQML